MELFHFPSKRLILLLTLLFGLGGCGSEEKVRNLTAPEIYKIQVIACIHLETCFSEADSSNCVAQTQGSTDWASRLGLNESYFGFTLQELIEEEDQDRITPQMVFSANCQNQITGLTCDSTQVLSAYDPTQPSDYSNTHELLIQEEESCSDVFTR